MNKLKQKIITMPAKKITKKSTREYYRNLIEEEKLKKEIMLTLELKICRTQDREIKKTNI